MKLIINRKDELKINSFNERLDNTVQASIENPENFDHIKTVVSSTITSLVVIRETEEKEIELDFSNFNILERLDRRITDDVDSLIIIFKKNIVE